MAHLYPSMEVINRMKPQPTEGELTLLNFLVATYDDTYDIFFQPFLNGDLPDIILMHKGGGVMIFEVKDWNLDNYTIDSDGRWKVRANDATNYANPVQQVLKYKENLYNIHIDQLYDLHLKDYKYWYVVQCALYFHCHTHEDAYGRLLGEDANPKYREFLEKNITILGKDSLSKENMGKILYDKYISYSRSKYFTPSLYDNFFRILKPSYHTLEVGRDIKLIYPQDELAVSEPGARKRIKGVAGSGKTLILAHRAVDAYQKTQEKVLILTFNITLRNYIHDKISQVRQEFPWEVFHISNYHDFINSQLRNLCLKPFSTVFAGLSGGYLEKEMEERVYGNVNLFESFEDKLPKYKTILIDEAQDFNENWYRLLLKYFAQEDAEVVAFADEKQNVYARPLDESKQLVVPISKGRWDARLTKSVRIPANMALLLNRYQENFFSDKYNIVHLEGAQRDLYDQCEIRYIGYSPSGESNEDKEFDVVNFIYQQIIQCSYSPNDVTVLASRIKTLQHLNERFREESHENTNVMFETNEEVELLRKNMKPNEVLNNKIDKLRKMRKANFWANRGTYKLSTIFSFKGWESPVLFLIIESGSPQRLRKGQLEKEGELKDVFTPEKFSDELVYTGLTRCKGNLYIINIDYENGLTNNVYDKFFRSLPDTIVTKINI